MIRRRIVNVGIKNTSKRNTILGCFNEGRRVAVIESNKYIHLKYTK